MLFDAHTHINNEEYTPEGREELIKAIIASDVSYAVDIGFDVPSSFMAAEHAAKYDWCYAAVGVHPHDTDTMTEDDLEAIRRAAALPGVKAIGEIGLDYFKNYSSKEKQQYWFRRQIQLANELGMPIVIHERDAVKDVMDILIEEGAFSEERKARFPKRPGPAGNGSVQSGSAAQSGSFAQSGSTAQSGSVAQSGSAANGAPDSVDGERTIGAPMLPDARVLIHCFSGSAETAAQYVKLGATISICGPVTYKNNRRTVEAVAKTPIEFLTAETDAPYLTPVPFRGKPNMSPYVEYTVRKIAEIKGITYEEAAAATLANGKRFYGVNC